MRQWNKETINEQLKLHKKQNKDERYNYFSREFNSLWYCWELEKYTISLQNQLQQKENIVKELKERSLQYSEEIDRLLDIKEKVREIFKDYGKEDIVGYTMYNITGEMLITLL